MKTKPTAMNPGEYMAQTRRRLAEIEAVVDARIAARDAHWLGAPSPDKAKPKRRAKAAR